MADVYLGKGNLAGKGVYAARDFRKGEIVIQYNLQALSQAEFDRLPEHEQMFTHTHWGQIFLYGSPERYVNHAENPNTLPDLEKQCDVAIRDITTGEQITTDASKDDV